MDFKKSQKLEDVCYEIRGPILKEARRLEEEGYSILKLNIGNPAPFGFNAPDEIVHDVIMNLPNAQGYCDSRGLYSARKAIMQYNQTKGIMDAGVDDIFVGNGVSELVVMSMQGFIDDGDEILVPAPDYPLWTAAVTLSGGNPVHYVCDEQADWFPDLDDIKGKITSRTKGIVVINPNNPTGSVYSQDLLERLINIARQHGLAVFSDEIYDKILYDGAKHVSLASLSDDLLFITYNGLSKSYRVAGFRSGWMTVSGKKTSARDYIEGLEILASMRLCSNVPGQFAIQTALGGYQSIGDLVLPGGRLKEQRDLAYELITAIPGVTCVKPRGALYLFPRIDTDMYSVTDDEKFVLDLLLEKHLLLVQGTGFNWMTPDHFRLVFLPNTEDLAEAMTRLADFLSTYRQ